MSTLPGSTLMRETQKKTQQQQGTKDRICSISIDTKKCELKMPYQSDSRPPGLPMPQHQHQHQHQQHQSIRIPVDRPGIIGMSRRSPTHGCPPPMNPPPPFNRHDYHHQPQPPRHLGNIPPHFNERHLRGYPPYNPPHGVAHRQGDEHVNQQYPVSRRGPPQPLPPPQSPRPKPSGQEGPPHNLGPPPNLRRNPQYSYGQGFYEYGDYNRPLPPSDTHTPPMRPPRRDSESRRFVHRPIDIQDHQHMVPPDSRHRNVMGVTDHPSRHTENWRIMEPFDEEYNSHCHEDNIPPPPQMQRNLQYRIADRVFHGPPYGPPRVARHNYEQFETRRMPFDQSLSNSEDNSGDEQSSGPRSDDENGSPGRDDLSNHIGCTCKKSLCLKLYCQCFASSTMCSASCRCVACKNTPKCDIARNEAIRSILLRNPNAFDTKFKPSTGGKSSKVTHKLGCKCRKSACLKKYCECYSADVKCSSNCRCVGCRNMPNSDDRSGASRREYVPTSSMMDAARDLAGLKSTLSGKITHDVEVSDKTQKIGSPPRGLVSNQDLYPVPTLTNSETPSKDDDTLSEEHLQQQTSGKQVCPSHVSPFKNSPGKEPSSSVDILLSAAYALTELHSAARSPVKSKNVEVNGNVISPSPKRKLSDLSYQSSSSAIPCKRRPPLISSGTGNKESLLMNESESKNQNETIQLQKVPNG